MTSVSVVVCTRNGSRWIEAQLRSIIGQTRPPDQIVVADDGSSDDTVERVQQILSGQGIPWSLIRRDSALGVVGNFSDAMGRAVGDVVATADQDDVWAPTKLDALLAILEGRPDLELVHSDARLVDTAGRPLGDQLFEALAVTREELSAIHAGDAFHVLLRRNIVTGATMAFRRDLLDRALPVPEGWIHDEWIAMIASLGGGIEVVEQALIDYRQHGSNQIGAQRLDAATARDRLRESRAERNARLLTRAGTLAARVGSMRGIHPAAVHDVRGKLEHERRRSRLPAARLRRVVPVVREAFSGGYRRWGRGAIDVVRDIVQPR